LAGFGRKNDEKKNVKRKRKLKNAGKKYKSGKI